MTTEMNGKSVLSAAADNTAQKQQIGRPFEPGESGNPAGRPKGSRNKLSEEFLRALADDFETNGAAVIEQVRTERPHDYLKVCASVLPKRLESEDVTEYKNPRQMSDAELEAILWKSYRGIARHRSRRRRRRDQARARRKGSLQDLAQRASPGTAPGE
jgi:hypothetical protein